MEKNIFVCQLSQELQSQIRAIEKDYMLYEDIYVEENLNAIMDYKIKDLNQDGFERQYEIILNLIENEDKLIKYMYVVNTLQQNDHNGTYNEILKDNEYNINNSIEELRECLKTSISESDEEVKSFYKRQLYRLENI